MQPSQLKGLHLPAPGPRVYMAREADEAELSDQALPPTARRRSASGSRRHAGGGATPLQTSKDDQIIVLQPKLVGPAEHSADGADF